jgi:hypothetical protein
LQVLLGVTRSTMMGFPCLRVAGQFFAAFDRRTQHLVVKLPAARVAGLIETGSGAPFAPSGRRFREWVAVPPEAHAGWRAILEEALTFGRTADMEERRPETRRQWRTR